MKGKLYDTETAKEIAEIFHGDGYRDYRHYSETLYRKRTGEYFLHGEGGPMSKYAETIGQNMRQEGERIIPLGFNEARQWAEENMNADDYQEEFGEVSEDAERTVLSISVDAAVADRIRKAAAEAGVSVSAIIASKF